MSDRLTIDHIRQMSDHMKENNVDRDIVLPVLNLPMLKQLQEWADEDQI